MQRLPSIVAKTYEDTVDIAQVDLMLTKIKTLLKKALSFKKIQRDLQQNQLTQAESQLAVQNMKRAIEQMNKNAEIKPISDKGITNLFYFRTQKQINFYKKAIPKLQKLTIKLQGLYERQQQNSQFNLNEIFLLSHKQIVQILISSKKKSEQKVKEIKLLREKIQQNFIKIKPKEDEKLDDILEFDEKEDDISKQKTSQKFIRKARFSIQAHTSDNIKENYENDEKEAYQCEKINLKIGEDSTFTTDLHLQLKNENNHLDKLKALNEPHLLKLYSCLDIQLNLDIYNYFIQTLPPKDNIDFIIKKMHFTNKKQRKQIKEYITCYILYQKNKQEKVKVKKNNSFIKLQNMNTKMKKKSLSDFSRIKSRSNMSFSKNTILKISNKNQKRLKSISNGRFNTNSKKDQNSSQSKKNNILKENLIRRNLILQNSNKNSKIESFNKASLKTMFNTFSKKQSQNQRQSPKLKL